ncbi:MAG: SDR family NAD(P)-dependent oxidoreductase [Thermomicrobiales bacterium]
MNDETGRASGRGRVAVVTGAGSGVGRATAVALAGEGYALGLVGRREGPLRETAAMVEGRGGRALALPGDIGAEAAVGRAMAAVEDAMGGLDALVCAAGVGLYGPVEGYGVADFEETLRTNLTGVFLWARAAIGPMRARGGGAIVAVGSGAGKQGYANLAAYGASKFGLLGFMQSLAAEVGADGIKVSTVVPGSILTDFAGGSAEAKRDDPGGKAYLEPEDVAAAIVFLLGQPARAWTQELNLWPVVPPG